jgi:hypothetical protein
MMKMETVIPTNQPIKGHRKSFSDRNTMCASSGVAVQIHAMSPSISNVICGQLSDMISCIFADKDANL